MPGTGWWRYKNGGTTLASYSYDGLGRRIIENTEHDDGPVLLEPVAGAGGASRRRGARSHYVWSPVYVDALVLRDQRRTGGGTLSERLCVQQDANWNVTALVNAVGERGGAVRL